MYVFLRTKWTSHEQLLFHSHTLPHTHHTLMYIHKSTYARRSWCCCSNTVALSAQRTRHWKITFFCVLAGRIAFEAEWSACVWITLWLFRTILSRNSRSRTCVDCTILQNPASAGTNTFDWFIVYIICCCNLHTLSHSFSDATLSSGACAHLMCAFSFDTRPIPITNKKMHTDSNVSKRTYWHGVNWNVHTRAPTRVNTIRHCSHEWMHRYVPAIPIGSKTLHWSAMLTRHTCTAHSVS